MARWCRRAVSSGSFWQQPCARRPGLCPKRQVHDARVELVGCCFCMCETVSYCRISSQIGKRCSQSLPLSFCRSSRSSCRPSPSDQGSPGLHSKCVSDFFAAFDETSCVDSETCTRMRIDNTSCSGGLMEVACIVRLTKLDSSQRAFDLPCGGYSISQPSGPLTSPRPRAMD